jgi:hypothetical protein
MILILMRMGIVLLCMGAAALEVALTSPVPESDKATLDGQGSGQEVNGLPIAS